MSGKGKIDDIVANWPGSSNDSRILANSQLSTYFTNGEYPGRLLGDSGYPLKTWLFTPVMTATTPAEEEYNR
jgi:hypothetical protein